VSTDIKSLSQLLNEIVKKYELNEIIQKNLLIEKFNEIVGEQIAKQVEFLSFERGILKIKVESSSWKNELFLLREQIIEKINKSFGKDLVKQINIL
jgi:predicted nucleic acid-binding Zn ribbon protein